MKYDPRPTWLFTRIIGAAMLLLSNLLGAWDPRDARASETLFSNWKRVESHEEYIKLLLKGNTLYLPPPSIRLAVTGEEPKSDVEFSDNTLGAFSTALGGTLIHSDVEDADVLLARQLQKTIDDNSTFGSKAVDEYYRSGTGSLMGLPCTAVRRFALNDVATRYWIFVSPTIVGNNREICLYARLRASAGINGPVLRTTITDTFASDQNILRCVATLHGGRRMRGDDVLAAMKSGICKSGL